MARSPTYVSPRNKLKEKAGSGGLPEHLLLRGQKYLENNPVDFTPYAGDLLKSLLSFMKTVKHEQAADKTISDLTKIIMQLKANGSMFHYQLISMTSDVVLRFMENVKRIDADFLDILRVYTHVLQVIVEKRLTGNGGNEGYILTEELHRACERYNKKYGIS